MESEFQKRAKKIQTMALVQAPLAIYYELTSTGSKTKGEPLKVTVSYVSEISNLAAINADIALGYQFNEFCLDFMEYVAKAAYLDPEKKVRFANNESVAGFTLLGVVETAMTYFNDKKFIVAYSENEDVSPDKLSTIPGALAVLFEYAKNLRGSEKVKTIKFTPPYLANFQHHFTIVTQLSIGKAVQKISELYTDLHKEDMTMYIKDNKQEQLKNFTMEQKMIWQRFLLGLEPQLAPNEESAQTWSRRDMSRLPGVREQIMSNEEAYKNWAKYYHVLRTMGPSNLKELEDYYKAFCNPYEKLKFDRPTFIKMIDDTPGRYEPGEWPLEQYPEQPDRQTGQRMMRYVADIPNQSRRQQMADIMDAVDGRYDSLLNESLAKVKERHEAGLIEAGPRFQIKGAKNIGWNILMTPWNVVHAFGSGVATVAGYAGYLWNYGPANTLNKISADSAAAMVEDNIARQKAKEEAKEEAKKEEQQQEEKKEPIADENNNNYTPPPRLNP